MTKTDRYYSLRIYDYNKSENDELIKMYKTETAEVKLICKYNNAAVIERKFNGKPIKLVMPLSCVYTSKMECDKAVFIINSALEKQDPEMLDLIKQIQELNKQDIEQLCLLAAQEVVETVIKKVGENNG